MPIIDNVVFFYTKLQKPTKKYQSEDLEWSVDCAVPKSAAKAWNKEFPKQKAKEFDNDEFLEKFKVEEVPFPEQEEQFVIKLKKVAVKNGKKTPDKYRPRVLVPSEEGNVDVTYTTLVSNGSKGKAGYVVQENDFGVFAQLSSILVEDLIEYTSNNGAGAEFGGIAVVKGTPPVEQQEHATEEDTPEQEEEAPKQAPKKTPPKKEPPKEETPKDGGDEDPNCPF